MEKGLIEKLKERNQVQGERLERLNKMQHILKDEDINSDNKKKIAIIYDVEGWAFHNIAKEIKKNISEKYEIDILPKSIFYENIARLMLLAQRYDLVHLLWRGMFSEIEGDYIQGFIWSLGISPEDFVKRYVSNTLITTSVYDHNFLNKDAFWITEAFFKYSKEYTVSSKKLLDIYNKLNIDKKPAVEITDGVDLEKFKPQKLERFSNITNRTINIGWVGNSKFTDSENDADLKGVRRIIIPAIEELKKEGYNIERKFADRNEGYIPHDKMPDYYNSIDLYICASKEEGTPNPVLESMACGVPVITTDVGIVKEAFGNKQKKYILEARSKENLKKKIVNLIDNPKMFKELAEENLKQIQDWSWEKKAKQFEQFFENCLKNE